MVQYEGQVLFGQVGKPIVQAERDAQLRFGLFISSIGLMGDASKEMFGVSGVVSEHINRSGT